MPLAVSRDGGAARVVVSGALDRTVSDRIGPLVGRLTGEGVRDVAVDLAGLERFDSVALADLAEAVRTARAAGARLRIERAPRGFRETFSLVPVEALVAEAVAPAPPGLFERAGRTALPVARSMREQFRLLVETFHCAGVAPFRGGGPRLDRCARELSKVGVHALPIVIVIALLLGVILAMQAAAQLRRFGASIYVANLVAVSLTREIGPLLTAILVAGRSGSACAAELGTMVVSEEIDALRQMGLHPIRYLVVPKILALAVAVPALALFADAVGILGGTLFASASLGIPARLFLEQTRDALVASDLTSGLVKGFVFGGLVGTIGCAEGLTVEGGAGEVGRATTRAVVSSIFAIILADAFFTALFHGR